MRILFCTDTFAPQVNGVSVVTHRSVAGLHARGCAVGVVAPAYPRGQTERSVFAPVPAASHLAVPSVRFPPYPEIRLAAPAVGEVDAAIEVFRPDLVHSVTEFTIGWLGQRLARRRGIPVTSSYHTDFGRYLKAYGVGVLSGPTTRYLARFHRRSTRVYTPSEVARDELRQAGVEAVEVWGRGVDLERFGPERRCHHLRRQLGLGDRFVFLHVGRLAPEKSVEVILDAFGRTVRRIGPERVALVVGGEGPSRSRLERRAPPGVVFVGYLDRNRELPELYATADAFVFASTTETLGLVVLEAMASGLPVVAAPAGGVMEHLRSDENGLAFRPGDAEHLAFQMEELVARPSVAARLAAGALAWARRFGWEAELDRLQASYGEVITGRTPSRSAA